jgi:hypothetical protein
VKGKDWGLFFWGESRLTMILPKIPDHFSQTDPHRRGFEHSSNKVRQECQTKTNCKIQSIGGGCGSKTATFFFQQRFLEFNGSKENIQTGPVYQGLTTPRPATYSSLLIFE